jgi:glycosyltransferase involved in cell wall biosynthesis
VQHSPWVAYGGPLDVIERVADLTLGRTVIRAAGRVVCVSEHTAEYVRTIVPDAATVVVPNSVDDRFRPDPTTARSAQALPRVLFVGRLVRRNGWSVLVDAWRRSGLEGRAELHIVGSGPDERAIGAAVNALTGVRLIGHLPDGELVDRYRSAHFVVVPTIAGEGFGLVAAEALACGTPVVASAQGGLREVVRHGVDGLLVPPGDPEALARTMRRVLDDAALHSQLVAGVRARGHEGVGAFDGSIDALLDVLVAQVAQVERQLESPMVGARADTP